MANGLRNISPRYYKQLCFTNRRALKIIQVLIIFCMVNDDIAVMATLKQPKCCFKFFIFFTAFFRVAKLFSVCFGHQVVSYIFNVRIYREAEHQNHSVCD